MGELVDLYRGVVLRRYPMTIASLNSKTARYNELISYYNYKNGQELTLFERISNGSTMEERLNFVYLMSKADALQGETIDQGKSFRTSEKGNSMTPLIKSGQEHVLSPINLSDVEVGDIVFCKVKGRYYTHLVKAKGDRGVLIGNNHGKINGWTKSVFGKVTKIL